MLGLRAYHTIPYSFSNVADIRNLQQYCHVYDVQNDSISNTTGSYIQIIDSNIAISDDIY